jgi:hypothetical protein
MTLVPRDPTRDICPDFVGPAFAMLIDKARKEVPSICPERAHADVVADMVAAWITHQDTKTASWEAAKRKREEEERAVAKAAAQKAREADDDKHIKITEPEDNAGPSDEAPLVVHPFATKRVIAREYVPLDYWSKVSMLHVQSVSRTRAHGGTTKLDT